jgi:hypothetical protein
VLAHALGHARLGPVPATGAALNYFPEYAPKNLMPLGFREASAKREMAADAEAVEILGRAGVNASGLLRYLERAKAAPERLRALRAKMEAIGVAANHLPETDECEIVQAWLNEQNAARPKPTLREPLRTSPRPPIN